MEPIVLPGVSKSFGGKAVLRDFSAAFPNPGLTAIMGSSGAGKTTLIRILLGLIRPDPGHITGLSGLTPSVVFQENRLFPGLTALENAEAAGVKGGSGRYWLKRLRLGDALDLRPQALSGGMQRRVAIARALCYGGNFLVLDEPFKGLDIDTRAGIFPIFREVKREKAVLLITHDPEEAEALADHLVKIEAIPAPGNSGPSTPLPESR